MTSKLTTVCIWMPYSFVVCFETCWNKMIVASTPAEMLTLCVLYVCACMFVGCYHMQDYLENSNYVHTRFIFAGQGGCVHQWTWKLCWRLRICYLGHLPETGFKWVGGKKEASGPAEIGSWGWCHHPDDWVKIHVDAEGQDYCLQFHGGSSVVLLHYCGIISSSEVAPVHAMKARVGVEVFFHPFLNSTHRFVQRDSLSDGTDGTPFHLLHDSGR